MAFEILFGLIMVGVVVGIAAKFIYNKGFIAGKAMGQMEEEGKWKDSEAWQVKKAEKHV
jgi:hypothetical protein